MERASTPQATHEVEVLPDAVRVSLAGEFDLMTEQDLTTWLVGAIEAHPGRPVEVDMDRVTFLDSSGIRVLLSAHGLAARHGGSFRLTRASGMVREVLDIVDVYAFLSGEGDGGEAGPLAV
ncbi:STAS domain-containing protein [Catellatospora sp. IY07-71]|uniref:STAS domain-containing protein n=1 Tax=Catellatospora sp. IY07-71 TaxID=2728827 RepID=UPI001BB310FC|nr:STAS domain-containing protein [Catellatospora sp. IY07-71]